MTLSDHLPSPAPHGSPIDTAGPRIPLYVPEFAVDPHSTYREMRRRYGSLVPVEVAPGVPATLVIGYYTAVRIFNDPDHFPADPRVWQQNIPRGCPVLPLMQWRPNARRNDGSTHIRYRQAIVAGLTKVDPYSIHDTVAQVAVPLINSFCGNGSADLIRDYAFPLTFAVLNAVLGCPTEIAQRAAAGMAAIFEGVGAERGAEQLMASLVELITLKRTEPGDDVTTRIMQHPTDLNETEIVNQVATLYGAGIEPLQNLIVNALRLMLTDEQFGASALDGSLSTRDAIDEVLFNDPPMANFCFTFPKQPILIEDVWLPANQPVVISMAACNTDPVVGTSQHTGNRAHLAFGGGAHVCPASSLAYLIAQDAIDQLLDGLPEIRLGVPAADLTWRTGAFHRALTALPVVFPPSPPLSPV
ncbi:cytochrome P450 [Nocardia jinanensis]|uniref:Cytochrome P450 n=1 Tax=Nocardia jinanensis TaxID=382504 RepID=A0A917R4J0_9NOCA|nr:cytochrome P450 [Nocardia jinanensis]GGK89958.1 cytochrome P450 [Nocardia jinanensis]